VSQHENNANPNEYPDPTFVFDNPSMTVFKKLNTGDLSHFKIKAPGPIKGNPYWVQIDLSYLEITVH
jgi:hypothetical protein